MTLLIDTLKERGKNPVSKIVLCGKVCGVQFKSVWQGARNFSRRANQINYYFNKSLFYRSFIGHPLKCKHYGGHAFVFVLFILVTQCLEQYLSETALNKNFQVDSINKSFSEWSLYAQQSGNFSEDKKNILNMKHSLSPINLESI